MLESQISDAENLSVKMKNELRNLEAKLNEAYIKRDHILNKKRAAESKKKMIQSQEKLSRQLDKAYSVTATAKAYDGFDRYEDSIDRQMAELEAKQELRGDDVEAEFLKLRQEKNLEDELEALKAKVAIETEEKVS